MDVVVLNSGDSNVGVYMNDKAGALQPPNTFSTDTGPTSMTTGDFDADGKVDIAVPSSDENSMTLLVANGSGSFSAAPELVAIINPLFITNADINADAQADRLVAGNGNQEVHFIPTHTNSVSAFKALVGN